MNKIFMQCVKTCYSLHILMFLKVVWVHYNESDSPFNLTLLIICQSNANLKTEWVFQNELLSLKLGKSSIRMSFTWQGNDHIQEI